MITLEILAAYLPYKLECFIADESEKSELLGLEKGFESDEIYGMFDEFSSVEISGFKPILRPLSEYEPTFNEYFKPYWSSFDFFCKCANEGTLTYCEMTDLISKHYNVFNLKENEYIRKG